MVSALRGEQELENFNVRVLYDKLEDQNLHLASQLARQQEDLRGFYERISSQNDDLKHMLNDLDLQKLEEIERERHERGDGVEQEATQGGSTAPKMVTTAVTLGGTGKMYRFTGETLYLFIVTYQS